MEEVEDLIQGFFLRLSMTEGAVKMAAVHRMRQRFRDTLREEFAQTVTDPGEIDDELQALFSFFD